jgi:hypothetical protein
MFAKAAEEHTIRYLGRAAGEGPGGPGVPPSSNPSGPG